MKKLIAAAAVAAFACGAANAAHFIFTDQVNSHAIHGSFDGTLSSNLITGLSNISVYIDGVGFNGNGSLFASYADPGTGQWMSGGGVASLDGTGNDFLFVDSDYPTDTSFTNYFFSVAWANTSQFGAGQTYDYSETVANFRATAAGVPEPASWAMMLGGFALAGAALRSRRTKVHFI